MDSTLCYNLWGLQTDHDWQLKSQLILVRHRVGNAMRSNHLVGTWTLVSFSAVAPNGKKQDPFGDNPLGQLIYTNDGHMAAVLSRTGRSKFASPDPLGGTPSEIKEAFEGMEAYAGTYEINEKEAVVTHRPLVSRMPNWEGGSQQRHFKLDGNRLVLSTPPFFARGSEWVLTLTWQRCE
jgi:hypothetical protein